MAYVAKPGDVLEFVTNKGLSYVQITHHRDQLCGPVLRLIEGNHACRPDDMGLVAQGKTLFYFFLPIQAAVRSRKHKFFEVVGSFDVPEADHEPPYFISFFPEADGTVKKWHILKLGGGGYSTFNLSDVERKYNNKGFINPALLKNYIETGWMPELDIWRNR